MTQFYSRNDVNYSGDVYSIPFDYIDKKEVKVYIDDELWTKWHFLSEHQLTLDEVPEDIRYSNIISVRRETNITDKVVTYNNNSLLNKENLNLSQDQLLYAVQEIYDNNTQNNIDIRTEVDEKVERVANAVDQLEKLNEAIDKASNAAEEASNQAEEAGKQAEAAEISRQEADRIYNQVLEESHDCTDLARDWATSEVLVDNIDYSAKYYAEKAKDNSGIFYDEVTDEDIDVEILDVNYATKSDLELGLDTKQDKGNYALRSEIPSITHLATKNEVNAKQDKGDYATRTELSDGLDTKQAKGNYALKSEIPSITHLATKNEIPTQLSELENDSNFATQTQVMQAIASIPQFSLSIVNELPATGEKMTLYFVPKEGADNDIYNEYVWIEQTSSYEFLGSTAVDLTDYVKKTDFPRTVTGVGDIAGVVKTSGVYGITASGGYIRSYPRTLEQYNSGNSDIVIGKATLENIKNDLVKRAVTENDIELTDDEKTSARTWLGAIGATDYAGATTAGSAGIVKCSSTFACGCVNGYIQAMNIPTLERYNNLSQYAFIGKATLQTALTEYAKTVSLTQAEYDALETKDANTLYLIEE